MPEDWQACIVGIYTLCNVYRDEQGSPLNILG